MWRVHGFNGAVLDAVGIFMGKVYSVRWHAWRVQVKVKVKVEVKVKVKVKVKAKVKGKVKRKQKSWRWAGRSRWKEMPGRPLSTLASHARSQVVVVWTCLGHL